MRKIPKGSYQIGTNSKDGFKPDKEGPQITVELGEFFMDATTVTNQDFFRFTSETGYVTEAEKFGWSFVFHYFLSEETKKKSQLVSHLSWWYAVEGADWKHPEGPDSTISDRLEHPVVHVTRNDAVAYCQWIGKRLPTEAEWEVAAKGGTDFDKYPWGTELLKDGKYHCNIWQGDFPKQNSMADGFASTAPVKSFEPNGYGIYQSIGNVWEWCCNPAKIDLNEFQTHNGSFFWQKFQTIDDESYATRGGSFLCHQSYCKRYRIAARNGNTGMSSANNLGFRCVSDSLI